MARRRACRKRDWRSRAGGIISGTGGAFCAIALCKNVPTNKAAGKNDSGYNLSSLTEHNRFDATLGRKRCFSVNANGVYCVVLFLFFFALKERAQTCKSLRILPLIYVSCF